MMKLTMLRQLFLVVFVFTFAQTLAASEDSEVSRRVMKQIGASHTTKKIFKDYKCIFTTSKRNNQAVHGASWNNLHVECSNLATSTFKGVLCNEKCRFPSFCGKPDKLEKVARFFGTKIETYTYNTFDRDNNAVDITLPVRCACKQTIPLYPFQLPLIVV